MEVITKALVLGLFYGMGCSAKELPDVPPNAKALLHLQVGTEPTPDVIPYFSLTPLLNFLNENDLNDAVTHKFFLEFARELKDVIVYGEPTENPDKLLHQCQEALLEKKNDNLVAEKCAQAATADVITEQEIPSEKFGFMRKTITAEIHELGAETDIFYITVENDLNYLLSAKPGVELKAGKVCEMEGLLSIVSDKSFRHFNKHLSREFVVSNCKSQHK